MPSVILALLCAVITNRFNLLSADVIGLGAAVSYDSRVI